MKNKFYLTTIAKAFAASIKIIILLMVIGFSSACKKAQDVITPAPTNNGSTTTTPITTPTPETFPVIPIVGRGYDITLYYADKLAVRAPVIDNDLVLKLYKARLLDEKMAEQGNTSVAGENVDNISRTISGKIKVSSGFALFKASVSYFDSLSFKSDLIYANYDFYIKRRHIKYNAPIELLQQLTTATFREDAENQSPAYLVQHYGTSVLADVVLGARFEALYRARTTSTDRKTAASAGLSFAVAKIFDLNASGGLNSTAYQYNYDAQLFFKAIGGDPSISLTGVINLGPTLPSQISTETWQRSVTNDAIELIDYGSSDPMIELADLIPNRVKSDAVRAYVKQYLIDRQVKMVDAPVNVYQYMDYNTSAIAYSTDQLPSLYGRFTLQSAAFKAYTKSIDGAIPVYNWYNPSRGEFILSTDRNLSTATYIYYGICFYAFPANSVPGTSKIFEYKYEAKVHKTWYYAHLYSPSNQPPQGADWSFTGAVPFYAFQ